jgi:hypothetical protein
VATIGFLSGSSTEEPAPAKKGSTSATPVTTRLGVIDPNFAEFRKPWHATGFCRGIAQATASMNKGRDLVQDFQRLIQELADARPGASRTMAEGRFSGYVWAVSRALQALAEQDVRLRLAPPDVEEMLRQLERHNGVV